MINLLPDDYKKELRAARANVVLLRYNLFTLIAVAFLVISCALIYVLVSESKRSAEEANSANVAKASSYASTKKEAEEYRKNLATTKKILDNEVNYTDVIFAITSLLPKGVVLDSVNLNASDFGNQTNFSAHAKSYEAAAQLKENFQNSKLFTNVFFQTINTAESGSDPYPISVNISVKINKVTN